MSFGYERLVRSARASPGEFLLLYGSLGSREPMHAELALDKTLQPLGPREIHDSLYDLGEFPGLMLERERMIAELFKIRDASVLLRLDKYEQYDPAKPKESLFHRAAIQLPRYRFWIANKLHGHPTIDAWIYVYNQSIDGKHKIEERSWQDYKCKRQTGVASEVKR
jgi:gamma-glutamylcyclotransferase (GGCT)/AIG2-like uncharacterized protein YtfP